jgi:hypothetical protein
MISFSRVKENILEKGFRILKVIQFGAKTADVVGPFGDDSAPLKDMVAIYGDTSESGDKVILGYLNKNQISQPGEKRIFSLDSNGNLSFDIILRTDGTCEIGGNTHNAVKYIPLNAAIQSQVAAINAELSKIALGLNAIVPGSYTVAPIQVDLTDSKNEKIKTGG